MLRSMLNNRYTSSLSSDGDSFGIDQADTIAKYADDITTLISDGTMSIEEAVAQVLNTDIDTVTNALVDAEILLQLKLLLDIISVVVQYLNDNANITDPSTVYTPPVTTDPSTVYTPPVTTDTSTSEPTKIDKIIAAASNVTNDIIDISRGRMSRDDISKQVSRLIKYRISKRNSNKVGSTSKGMGVMANISKTTDKNEPSLNQQKDTVATAQTAHVNVQTAIASAMDNGLSIDDAIKTVIASINDILEETELTEQQQAHLTDAQTALTDVQADLAKAQKAFDSLSLENQMLIQIQIQILIHIIQEKIGNIQTAIASAMDNGLSIDDAIKTVIASINDILEETELTEQQQAHLTDAQTALTDVQADLAEAQKAFDSLSLENQMQIQKKISYILFSNDAIDVVHKIIQISKGIDMSKDDLEELINSLLN